MNFHSISTYIDIDSSVHHFDARSKIIMLLVYSICLFFVSSILGIVFFSVIFVAILSLSRIPFNRIFFLSIPIYIIATISMLSNAFVLTGSPSSSMLHMTGDLFISPEGSLNGCIVAIRMILLVWMSLIFCFSTTSEDMVSAVIFFLKPLRRLGVPIDDFSMMISIALRFIPLIANEYLDLRDAQWSRGASFSSGTLIARIKANCAILLPIIVGMFRRANVLALAMESRCYGISDVDRTELGIESFNAPTAAITIAFCAICIIIAILL